MPGAYLLNSITSDATITPSSEDATYPRGNLYDRQAARVFRATSSASFSILVSFPAATAIDTIAIVNHNFPAGASIELWGAADSPPTTKVATLAYRNHDIWAGFAPVAAKNWQLNVSGANSAAYQIGQLLLGTRVTLPRARRIGGFTPAKERGNITSETYAGVTYAYPIFKRERFDPTFRVLKSELAIMDGLDHAVDGNARPFVYIPDVTGAEVYYVRKEMSFEPQEFDKAGVGLVYDYQMTLVEESRGLEVVA